MSSTTVSVRMKPRSRSGACLPRRASRPRAKAVSVDIATPQPCAEALTGIDRQVEPDRAHHPAESREHGKDDPGTLSELADVEFPACLEPDDQEEEAHEPAVDPAAQTQDTAA